MSKVYRTAAGPVESLRGISLSVRQGEFLSFIGPSGCGKSTLLKIVGDVIEPTAGSIRVDGRPCSAAKAAHDFGFVFQDPVLLAWRTNFANVELPLEVLGTPATERRRLSEELLRLVDLDGFGQRYPQELSGGMRQRVSIARALSFDPAILLMDEPFGALDEITREAMNDELQLVWQRTGKTILFVTHSIPEAVFLSDRIVVMTPRPGRVAATVEVRLSRPRTQDMKESTQFTELARTVRQYLRGEP